MSRPRRSVLAALAAVTGTALAVTLLPQSASSLPGSAPATVVARAADPAFRVATFNVLGNSHTKRGRQAAMGPGVVRIKRAIRIINRRKLGLVGFQELQRPQLDEFARLKGSAWGLYPGTSLRDLDGENSIGWRQDTYRLVKAATAPIPYFDGNVRNMPVLLMQHRASGRQFYLINVHNPATNPKVGNQDKWRRAALAQEIALVNSLRTTTRLPVFLVGDLNDRIRAFCPLVQQTSLRAANGGSATRTTCKVPPRPRMVDWVFGTIGVKFTSYTALNTPYVRRTTDHPVVWADVRLAPPSDIVAP